MKKNRTSSRHRHCALLLVDGFRRRGARCISEGVKGTGGADGEDKERRGTEAALTPKRRALGVLHTWIGTSGGQVGYSRMKSSGVGQSGRSTFPLLSAASVRVRGPGFGAGPDVTSGETVEGLGRRSGLSRC